MSNFFLFLVAICLEQGLTAQLLFVGRTTVTNCSCFPTVYNKITGLKPCYCAGETAAKFLFQSWTKCLFGHSSPFETLVSLVSRCSRLFPYESCLLPHRRLWLVGYLPRSFPPGRRSIYSRTRTPARWLRGRV